MAVKKNFKLNIVWQEASDLVWKYYFYILGSYIILRFLSYFFISLKELIFWSAFNVFIAIFTIAFLLNPKLYRKFNKVQIQKKVKVNSNNKKEKEYFIELPDIKAFIAKKLKEVKWTKVLMAKIFIVFAILVFSLIYRVGIADLVVLIFGAIAVLFNFRIRYLIFLALGLLIAAPFLIVVDKINIAEGFAVFSYYFMIIITLLMLKELLVKKTSKARA